MSYAMCGYRDNKEKVENTFTVYKFLSVITCDRSLLYYIMCNVHCAV